MFDFAIIVRSKTRRELLQDKFQTHAQAKFYVERSGGTISDIDAEHDRFYQSLESLIAQLSGRLKYKIIDRSYVPSFLFAENHLIITIGQDGLVANTAKYAKGQPIIGVNPDPTQYDGVLLRTQVPQLAQQIDTCVTRLSKRLNRLAGFDELQGPTCRIDSRVIFLPLSTR